MRPDRALLRRPQVLARPESGDSASRAKTRGLTPAFSL